VGGRSERLAPVNRSIWEDAGREADKESATRGAGQRSSGRQRREVLVFQGFRGGEDAIGNPGKK